MARSYSFDNLPETQAAIVGGDLPVQANFDALRVQQFYYPLSQATVLEHASAQANGIKFYLVTGFQGLIN